MITVIREETKTVVDIAALEKRAQFILELMKYGDFDLGILLTDNNNIQRFNRDYRKKDMPTDILSFPFHSINAGETIHPDTEDDKNIGDIIISLEYIKDVCIEENKTIDEHLKTLLCHGICHLLGYDHYTESSDKVMKEKEAWLAMQLDKNNATQ